jgi:hypothetical protein
MTTEEEKDPLNQIMQKACEHFGERPTLEYFSSGWRAWIHGWHIHLPRGRGSYGSLAFSGGTAVKAVEWLLEQSKNPKNRAHRGSTCGSDCPDYDDCPY